jgi:hypothetical protein
MFEVSVYNNHITMLNNGTAPVSSYIDPDIQRNRLTAQNRNIYKKFSLSDNRSDYEQMDEYIFILRDDGIEYTSNSEDIVDRDILEEVLNQEINVSETLNYLSKPYDPYDTFSLGFGVLPLTKAILDQ